ncbi:MAG TPA: Ig-like domain-containing protein [Opitutaceae bacterium]|nr:Ig-like domain-containing protein [Opitutaceae bacterium]
MARAIFKGGLWPALLFVLTACVGVRGAPPAGGEVTIHWRTENSSPAVEVAGVSPVVLEEFATGITGAEAARVFAVFAEQPGEAPVDRSAMPAMSGTWSVAAGRLRFEPSFPLARGVRYRAEVRTGEGPPVISFFELPRESMVPTTGVVQVFPGADELPENQLKFYVQFSAPMSRGNVYEHIRVRDAAGGLIELPFLELGEELWDPSMTRLTLLIDPGRIKRGVKPLEETGPVFEAGKNYSLTIDAELRDAGDRPLRAAFAKKFRARAADRTPPDPSRWKIRPPAAGTRDAVVVEFDEPMDEALALRLIRIADDASGKETSAMLEGQPALGDQERSWRFVPAKPWRPGTHQLTVRTSIEDLAGNNIGKTFDVDVFETVQRRPASEAVSLTFEVR